MVGVSISLLQRDSNSVRSVDKWSCRKSGTEPRWALRGYTKHNIKDDKISKTVPLTTEPMCWCCRWNVDTVSICNKTEKQTNLKAGKIMFFNWIIRKRNVTKRENVFSKKKDLTNIVECSNKLNVYIFLFVFSLSLTLWTEEDFFLQISIK